MTRPVVYKRDTIGRYAWVIPNRCAPDPYSHRSMIEMHQADVDQDRLSGDVEKQKSR